MLDWNSMLRINSRFLHVLQATDVCCNVRIMRQGDDSIAHATKTAISPDKFIAEQARREML